MSLIFIVLFYIEPVQGYVKSWFVRWTCSVDEQALADWKLLNDSESLFTSDIRNDTEILKNQA